MNLTRIYTRLGDSGETHLGDMSRVPKTHPRIDAYGDIDELGALIGLALTVEDLPRQYEEWLQRVQNDRTTLFDLGADLRARNQITRRNAAWRGVVSMRDRRDRYRRALPSLGGRPRRAPAPPLGGG